MFWGAYEGLNKILVRIQSFSESDIAFTFGEDWVVKKYDDHAYYDILSGYGIKGVDFIGIYKNERLYLIEVKNYHKRSYSPVAPDLSDLKGVSPPLAADMHDKIGDSLRLIKIVNKYLARKWWYKISLFLKNTTRSQTIKKDWHFWNRVRELSENAQNVFPILWLEMDPLLLEQSDQINSNLISVLQKEYTKRKRLPCKRLQITSMGNNKKGKVLEDVVAKKKNKVKKEHRT